MSSDTLLTGESVLASMAAGRGKEGATLLVSKATEKREEKREEE